MRVLLAINLLVVVCVLLSESAIIRESQDYKASVVKNSVSSIEEFNPNPCHLATNFTEAWRLDHDGKNILPGGPHSSNGYACDLYQDIQWFRFTGNAGRQMYNKCPKPYSCGAGFPMWTDAAMPTAMGAPVNITVYGLLSLINDCKYNSIQVEVMRCSMSTDGDFVYRYTGNDGYYLICANAFCGMS